jgi:hypothetical protein
MKSTAFVRIVVQAYASLLAKVARIVLGITPGEYK